MIPEIEGKIEELKEYMEVVIADSRGRYKERVRVMLKMLLEIEAQAVELRK